MIPETNIPFALATVIDTIPFSGIRVGKPRPSTTVSGRVTSMVWSRLVDARGQDEVLPEPNALLIVARSRSAWRRRTSSIRMDEPGVAPAPHVVPTELLCTEGTKTL